MPGYPWYETVEGSVEIMQGDILKDCPLYFQEKDDSGAFLSDDDGKDKVAIGTLPEAIVLTQSCDLINKKATGVLLCPVVKGSGLENFGSKVDNLKHNKFVHMHLLNKCALAGFVEEEYRVVLFGDPFVLPFDKVKVLAGAQGRRLRLLSPYLERLSSCYAYFISRVGLDPNCWG